MVIYSNEVDKTNYCAIVIKVFPFVHLWRLEMANTTDHNDVEILLDTNRSRDQLESIAGHVNAVFVKARTTTPSDSDTDYRWSMRFTINVPCDSKGGDNLASLIGYLITLLGSADGYKMSINTPTLW